MSMLLIAATSDQIRSVNVQMENPQRECKEGFSAALTCSIMLISGSHGHPRRNSSACKPNYNLHLGIWPSGNLI